LSSLPNAGFDAMSHRNVPVRTTEIERRVVQTVSSHLGVRRANLHLDSHLQEQLGADLLDRIELAVTVEEEFGVRIPLEESMQVWRPD
jgi:acyl carrier protein